MRTFHDAKTMAKSLRQTLAARGVDLTHSETLEIVARQFGCDDWNLLAARIADGNGGSGGEDSDGGVSLQPPIPILRIFEVGKAMEFYRDFLGFAVDWEHRFGENFPLYCQVSRGAAILHLSEHAGDASPGAHAFVFMTGVDVLQTELTARDYRYMKPGTADQPWGRELRVVDPFSNRLTFCERPAAAATG
ncbi:MAG: glyoxalase superfamily protein [Rhodospirillaceae bacterium]